MKIGKCKLCLQQKELCTKSHIIPDFMYTGLLDENRGMANISLKEGKEKPAFTGEYEADILCQDCEGKISRFESYARVILYGGELPKNSSVQAQPQRSQDGAELLYITGLDYKLFKLFLLSILWRASISSRPFFKHISLGSYEKRIRKMLLVKDPGAASAYPCIMMSYRGADLPAEIVGEPRRTRNQAGCIGYTFLIHGTLYYFLISHKMRESWILQAAVNEQGELHIIHVPEEHGRRILNSFFGKKIF